MEKRQLDRLPDLDREQHRILKQIHNAGGGFAGHASSNAAVAAFLLMTNLITSPATLWSLIPITAMAIPVAIHWGSFRNKMRKLTRRLKELAQMHPAGKPSTGPASSDPSVIEAERLRHVILKQVEAMGDRAHLLGDDIPGLLDSYVANIRLVAGKVTEIDSLIAEIPVSSLEEDRRKLAERMEATDAACLKEEYRTSIEEIDRQLGGCKELQEQEELVRLIYCARPWT